MENYTCADCATKSCSTRDGRNPMFCMTERISEEELDKVMEIYREDELVNKAAIASAEVESEFYCRYTRVEETMAFARKMGAKKIGIATCVGLLAETRILAKILRKNGFEVVGVACKMGSVNKTDIGIPQFCAEATGPVMCNPVLQAMVLNREKTDLNVLMGLCVGHDSLFCRYSEALATTLVVKDRVLGHNPVQAIYQAESYYKRLLQKPTVTWEE